MNAAQHLALGLALAIGLFASTASRAASAPPRASPPSANATQPADARTADAAEPRIAVSLAPRELAVGDRVQATLTLRLPGKPPDLDPLFPDWQRGWGKAEVLSAQPLVRRAEGDATVFEQTLVLTAFEPGTVALPQVAVELPGSGRALTPEKLELAVKSSLPEGATDAESLAPKPPAPPRPLPFGPIVWWTLAGLGGLCLAAGAFAAQRRSKGARQGAVSAIPPLPELLAALAQLAGEGSPERGTLRLSLALRRYLGRRLGFHGRESSTTEVQRELAARRLAPPLVKRTVALLRDCDQVLFARRAAAAAALAAGGDEARTIAEAVEAHLAPPPEAAATEPPREAHA